MDEIPKMIGFHLLHIIEKADQIPSQASWWSAKP